LRDLGFSEGAVMRVWVGKKWASSVVLLFLAGCSATSSTPPSRINPTTGAGSGASSADSGTGTGGTGSLIGNNADNSSGLLPVSGGAGGATVDAGDDADGGACKTGVFCQQNKPDSTDCGHTDLKTNTTTIQKPGNVLVVFDRSGSMLDDWNGTPKYQAAGNALISAITPLKSLLTMGGIFFPSPAPADMTNCPMGCNVANPIHWIPGPGACCLNGVAMSCAVDTIDQGDEINWGTADNFITTLPTLWDLPNANGTPLEAGIMQAAAAISAKMFTDPLIVLVMTDGEPNCNTNQQNVLNQITTWHTAGINTHIVGLPGAQMAADFLNSLASAGGTMSYIDPADPTELETRLETVISSTVKKGFDSCVFKLDPKPDAPEKLHLIVTQNGVDSDVPRDLSKDAHWSLNADSTQVTLEGQLCDFAKDGTFDGLRFVYGCVTAPPLPPPPPVVLN
jgi:hypothetical protein